MVGSVKRMIVKGWPLGKSVMANDKGCCGSRKASGSGGSVVWNGSESTVFCRRKLTSADP